MEKKHIFKLACMFLVLLVFQNHVLASNSYNTKSSLRQIIIETINNNPDVLSNLKSLIAAGYATDAAQGDYLPKLDINGTAGKRSLSDYNTNYEHQNFNLRGGSIILTQNLFSGFGTLNEVLRNRYRTLAQEYQLQGVINEVALFAAKAYLDVLRTNKIVDIAKDNYVAHVKTYNMLQMRSGTGLGRKADATQAYGRMALAKANMLAANNNYLNSLATFRQITGISTSAEQLIFPDEPATTILPQDENTAQEEALYNHPLLKSANADIKEARAQLSARKAPNYPRLDVVGETTQGYDLSGLDGRYKDYSVYLRLNYNLFNGGSDIAKQREAAELVGKSQAIRDKTYRQVIENMQLAWNFYTTTQEQLKYFKRHENSAKTVVAAYREQFKLGQRTLLDLLDAEDELFNARVDNLNGKVNLVLSKYRILSAEDKLLSYWGIKTFVVK